MSVTAIAGQINKVQAVSPAPLLLKSLSIRAKTVTQETFRAERRANVQNDPVLHSLNKDIPMTLI